MQSHTSWAPIVLKGQRKCKVPFQINSQKMPVVTVRVVCAHILKKSDSSLTAITVHLHTTYTE